MGGSFMNNATVQYVYEALYSYIGNDYGVSALMGNIQCESGIISIRKQGDFTSDYSKSRTYTTKIDNGEISRSQFISDSIGYGLCQWTSSDRKRNLYDLATAQGKSIGDVDVQIQHLMNELQTDYASTLEKLVNATNIYDASTFVLTHFERPRDQSDSVKRYRSNCGTQIYNLYSGRHTTTH